MGKGGRRGGVGRPKVIIERRRVGGAVDEIGVYAMGKTHVLVRVDPTTNSSSVAPKRVFKKGCQQVLYTYDLPMKETHTHTDEKSKSKSKSKGGGEGMLLVITA